jgi:hypothetical protein
MNKMFRTIFAILGTLFVAGVIGRVMAESDIGRVFWNRALIEILLFAAFSAVFWGVGKNTYVPHPKPLRGKTMMVVGMVVFWASAIVFIISIWYPALPQLSLEIHLTIQGGGSVLIAAGVIISDFAKKPWQQPRIVKGQAR